MATANLNTNKVSVKFNNINAGTLTAFDATDGAEYTVSDADTETMLVLINTDDAATNVVIKAPTNPQEGVGSAKKDKTVAVGASEVAMVMVNSKSYVDSVTGKVKLTGSADVKGLLFEM